MVEGKFKGRIKIIEPLETLDVDFSDIAFTAKEDVDEFYDEVDRLLEATSRRWYFLVNYTGCSIADDIWDHFGERGKHSNITYGLGTVRFGLSASTRQTIRAQAMLAQFRANVFETREEALVALGELRKRREVTGVPATEALLRVQDVSVSFGGIQALRGLSFEVQTGEIFSIIGPNGAGQDVRRERHQRLLPPRPGTDPLPGQGPDGPQGVRGRRARHRADVPERGPVQGHERARQHHDRAAPEDEGQLPPGCSVLGARR